MLFKFPILIFHIMLFLSIGTEVNNNVTTQMKTPSEVMAGESFVVNMTINKGNLRKFARFQQDLPYGLKAEPISTGDAEFKFQDNKVKLIWLNLPENSTIEFSYTIHVKKILSGKVNLAGQFSYIANNQRKSRKISSRPITIKPAPSVDKDQTIDIRDYQSRHMPKKGEEDVACIRKPPQFSKDETEINVKLLVHKGQLNKFAKLEEQIPPGYIAEQGDTKNGIFVSKDNRVKFLWIQVPSQKNFTVSYKLIPKPEVANQRPNINGTFSYIRNEKTKQISIIQKNIQLAQVDSRASLQEIMSTSSDIDEVEMPSETKEKDKEKETDQDTKTTKEKKTDKANEQPEQPGTKDKGKAKDQTERQKDIQTTKFPLKEKNIHKSHILDTQSGVYYRVQLAAGHEPVNIEEYFQKYELNKTVKIERHEGWFKYSVGSFDIYKDARDHRNNIWNTTPIDGAFVTAYNDGVRITVQEALMITNQKWYK